MELDKAKFMTLVMEKTTGKLNELQAQVIVLEAQLQLAVEINKQLQETVDKIKKKEKSSEFQN